MSVNITSAAVASMQFHSSNARQLLAVGDDQGTVHVMEVPRNLRRAAGNEKAFAANFFVREERRVEYVQRRLAERAEEQAAKKAEKADLPPEPTTKGEDGKEEPLDPKAVEDLKLEAAFREMEANFKETMELNEPPAEPVEAE